MLFKDSAAACVVQGIMLQLRILRVGRHSSPHRGYLLAGNRMIVLATRTGLTRFLPCTEPWAWILAGDAPPSGHRARTVSASSVAVTTALGGRGRCARARRGGGAC